MKTAPQICILLLLILENQAQESTTSQTNRLEEEIITENSTISREVELIVAENNTRVKELEPLDDNVTENFLKIAPVQVFTENTLNHEDLIENTTDLNLLENKIISSEELISNITVNEEVQTVLNTEKKEVQTASNVTDIEEVQTVSNAIENKKVQSVTNTTEIEGIHTLSNMGNGKALTILKTENEQVQTILKGLTPITPIQQEINDTSSSSVESLESTTIIIIENEVTTKPLVTLEEYALKQMNFILDYLLIETQEFVAKVLQASINTVFQRDNLKRYAEGLNRLLNPDTDRDYSDEFVEPRNLTQDELYEEIVLKLNFLKSKPSKYLQRQIPQDWIREYRNKRAELTIWLDKASEQMHREFNRYVSEEEDYIKYQYFNEAFDDISRATEIHQKLALLADLVKIIKNKKKITFMDLYMQT